MNVALRRRSLGKCPSPCGFPMTDLPAALQTRSIDSVVRGLECLRVGAISGRPSRGRSLTTVDPIVRVPLNPENRCEPSATLSVY
jgi:hypothetical protein